MSLHKILYWPHLLCGVIAGIIILTMSVTGVLLTYERQMIEYAESDYYRTVTNKKGRLSVDEIVGLARAEMPDAEPSRVVVKKDIEAPVVVSFGRTGNLYMNPYSGEILGRGTLGVRAFFSELRSFHRWFSMTGESRATGRMFTNMANLMFLFILISGIYLWFPRVFKWANLKKHLFFQKNKSSRARDFNWHHVFGIWSVIPLIVIVATATVFYYGWANDLVYKMAGEEPPIRGGGQSEVQSPQRPDGLPLSLDTLLEGAKTQDPDWRTLTLSLPKSEALDVTFSVDTGNGGEPTKRGVLTLDRFSGETRNWVPFEGNSLGRQARIYIRFLHTGEALGPIGQTVAGLVSLFAILMIWTGLALAWRKYITPILGKKHD